MVSAIIDENYEIFYLYNECDKNDINLISKLQHIEKKIRPTVEEYKKQGKTFKYIKNYVNKCFDNAFIRK